MNRTEAKSFLPILQAFADGKEIECREEDKWYRVLEICNEINPQDYHIKPEPKYRPFKNAEECWQEMQKHHPFGWVRVINRYKNILELKDSKNGIELLEENWTYEELCERVTFADGTPFGIREC